MNSTSNTGNTGNTSNTGDERRSRLTRRGFLGGITAAASAAILAACGDEAAAPTATVSRTTTTSGTTPPTAASAATTGGAGGVATVAKPATTGNNKPIQMLQATGMVDAADAEFKRQVAQWSKDANTPVNVEIVANTAIGDKIAAAVSAQSGADIVLLQDYEAWLYNSSLLDVTRTVDTLKTQLKGTYDTIDNNCKVNGVYRAIPFTFFPSAWIYRTDWLKEQGYDKFPATMDDLMKAGTKLKAAGHPIGWSLAASNGDARANCYSVLWNFGGKETDETGTKVTLNSPEALEALKWAQQFMKDACDPAGYAWDGSGNNRAYAAKTISATINGASVYIQAKTADPALAMATDNAISPKGPGGGAIYTPSRSYGVTKWSGNPDGAQALLTYLLQPEQHSAWLTTASGYNNGAYHAYDDAKVFKDDPKLAPYTLLLAQGKWPGYPGPPNQNAAKVWQQDVIVNMFAKVQSGIAPQEALTAADAQMKKLYAP